MMIGSINAISLIHVTFQLHIDGLVQDCSNFSALAVELLQSCTKPPIWTFHYVVKSQSFNPGLQYPHLHGPVHTPDNNRWDTPPV